MGFETPRGQPITSTNETADFCIDSTPDAAGEGKKVALKYRYQPRKESNISFLTSPSLKIIKEQDNKKGVIDLTIQVMATNVAKRNSYIMVRSDGQFGTTDETFRFAVGKVELHEGYESDLLAQTLGQSSDADQIMAYWRVLASRNNVNLYDKKQWDMLADNPLKQNTGSNPKLWNCGGALWTFANRFMYHHSLAGGTRYYQTPAPWFLSKVKFRKEAVRLGAAAIRRQLKNGNVVQVFVGHNEELTIEGGIIQPSSNTHYITLFGASKDGKKFLFFDPWPRGSILNYKSGLLGDVRSIFMGEVEFHEDEGEIRSESESERWSRLRTQNITNPTEAGGHRYVLLTGL